MKRRDLLQGAAAFGLLAAAPFSSVRRVLASTDPAAAGGRQPAAGPNPLAPPAAGSIPVAFLLSAGAVVIDFCGPWEVFQDVSVPGRKEAAFRPYTVAETTQPITASGGLKIVPEYTLATAPAPKVVVIPAQNGNSAAMLEWIRSSARGADLTMSVCTGASLLAQTGLLAGKAATTHHHSYREFAMDFPDVQLRRGARFVEDGNLASSGGLSSGIDLAFRVVERYFGREVAARTAEHMEYQGEGWLNPNSNAMYASERKSTEAHPLCPVCWMDVDPQSAARSAYQGKNYYFCMPDHKRRFDATPDRYLAE
jgi:putative intracellular protease/amidase/YHS domain-containing protein